MQIRRRGPVTIENSIFHGDGSVSCPISTNKWTRDEYFTIDADSFPLVVGRTWYVNNTRISHGDLHFDIRTGKRESDPNYATGTRDTLLHQLLHWGEANAVDLEVDHVLHWTDNRRCSVEFVTRAENVRRGRALYHHHVRQQASRRRA